MFNISINLGSTGIFFVSALGAVLALISISLLFKRKTRIIVLLSMDLILSIVLIADIVYYRYYNDIISTAILLQARLANPALLSSILKLIKAYDFLYLLDIILTIPALVFIFKKHIIAVVAGRFYKRFVTFILVLAIGSSMITFGFYKLNEMMGFRSLDTVYDHGFFLTNIGWLNYHGFDIFYTISNNVFGSNKVSVKEKDKIASEIANRTHKDTVKNNYANVAKGKNLIVIQVESMQNFVLNMKIKGKEITPNLNKLIKDSIYSDKYFSQAAQGNTSDAEFISNNSYYALPQGAVYFRYPNNTFDSIANVLKQQGYSTMAFHAYTASYWNRATIYPSMGFDKFISQKDFEKDDILGGWGLSDKSFFRQSAPLLKKIKQPFYSFMITLSSHYPFEDFKNTDYFNIGSLNDTFLGGYYKCMHYADEALGDFIKDLKKEGLYNNTVIAIYGDHEAIKPENLDELRNSYSLPDSNDLASLEMKNIPLIIHLPHDQGKGTMLTAGGQVDLMPTLANLMGFKANYMLGRDLFNTKTGFAIFRDGSVTDGKTIYNIKDKQYYDYINGEKTSGKDLIRTVDRVSPDLNISDKIVENNLIKYFESKK
jgi:phosphoglycerol transferase MdoB-like AlkP superfamily enzyme